MLQTFQRKCILHEVRRRCQSPLRKTQHWRTVFSLFLEETQFFARRLNLLSVSIEFCRDVRETEDSIQHRVRSRRLGASESVESKSAKGRERGRKKERKRHVEEKKERGLENESATRVGNGQSDVAQG